MKDSHKRTFVKTLTWRILATIITMVVVLIFSGDLNLALGVGFVEFSAKMVIYYLHERAWSFTEWGVRKNE